MTLEGFHAETILRRLKDFQRRTAEHVFHRLYEAPDSTRRFLVADEVGLGKTMVAKGVIAKTLDHLRDTDLRIDIVYVCSNATIAAQNIARLNVLRDSEFAVPTRLTMLPQHARHLNRNRVNFISFTPGTTFDLKSRGGIREERALIFRMLRDEAGLDGKGLKRLLCLHVRWDNWKQACSEVDEPDPVIASDFRQKLRADRPFFQKLEACCAEQRDRRGVQEGDLALVGGMRRHLAHACVQALQPDLVILDEFQRFRDLLHGESDAAQLAEALFTFQDAHVLLLSATPYKMLSLHHEADEDHHRDFLRTLEFLFHDPARSDVVREDLLAFRTALQGAVTGSATALEDVRSRLESTLSKVMCRTERVGVTRARDSMLQDRTVVVMPTVGDLRQARLGADVGVHTGAELPMEYWKSVPYPLNFLKEYDFRRRFEAALDDPPEGLAEALQRGAKQLLDFRRIRKFQPIDLGNARLRDLAASTLDSGQWRILWIPPSMPYWDAGGAYESCESSTKHLVFSSWNAVPDAIATLMSYEAERRMLEGRENLPLYSELHRRVKGVLRFVRKDGRTTSMNVLALLRPCVTLAREIDPLGLALEWNEGGVPPLAWVEERALQRIQGLLSRLPDPPGDDRFPDRRWYWLAPLLLDAGQTRMSAWLEDQAWEEPSAEEIEDGDAGAFDEHVLEACDVLKGKAMNPPLGRRPSDLGSVLTHLALSGPGTVALRTLRRVSGSGSWDEPALLDAALRCGQGLRSLFNQPEAVALLRGEGDEEGAESYFWREVLRHGLQGNLQAMLDEHAHTLVESLGLQDATPAERWAGVAEAVFESASLRSSLNTVDSIPIRHGSLRPEPVRMRTRFAMRFAELKDDGEKTVVRADRVRQAFNSPFRPFVLASTSIGQEGLDFHTWCHCVVHWNLPSNPVDLEQREGRVHRFKGHAIRRNVARSFGMDALRREPAGWQDPWARLFELAAGQREPGANELTPYWVYETPGGHRVERRVPLLPLSRDEGRIRVLRRSLALYRLVFGQPRQEDLLEFLVRELPEASAPPANWHIRLEPQARPGPR